MRIGIVITLIGLLLLNAAMWATKPDLQPGLRPDRANALAMTTGLENWAFQRPLGAQVFARSWRVWYSEAYEDNKSPYRTATSKSELSGLMAKGGEIIQARMIKMTAASFGGAIASWLAVAILSWLDRKNPRGRGGMWLAGRLMLILIAVFVVGLAAPAVIAEDAPGLLFSLPLILGLAAAFALRKKGSPAA
jgi:hypothetical protein